MFSTAQVFLNSISVAEFICDSRLRRLVLRMECEHLLQRAGQSRCITKKELFQETEAIRVSLADPVTETLTGPRSWQEIGSGLSTNKGRRAQWRETESENKNVNMDVPFPDLLSQSSGSWLLTDTLYPGQ